MKGSFSILSRHRITLPGVHGSLRQFRDRTLKSRACWAALFACVLGIVSISAEAQESPKSEPPTENEDPLALEERRNSLFRRSSESHLKRAGYPGYLEENTNRLKKTQPLDESQLGEIDKLTDQVFEQLIELGIPAIEEQFARYSESNQKRWLKEDRSSFRIVPVSSIPDLPDPLKLEMWTAGLTQIIGKKQYTQWEEIYLRFEKKQQEEELRLLKEAFEFRRDRDEVYFEDFLAKRTSRIFADLSMTESRRNQIEATAEEFFEEVLASVQEEAIGEFEKASPIERQRLLKGAGSRSIISQRPESESEEDWTKVLTPLLNPKELEVLAKRSEKRIEENVRTVALAAFFALDRFLRFDAEQEAELLPIFSDRVRSRVQLSKLKHSPPLRLSNLVSDFRREENRKLLEPHLTPGQNERFSAFLDLYSYSGFRIDFETPSRKYEGDKLTDEIRKDILVGNYMTQRLEWERDRRIIPLLSRIEEMDRANLLKAAVRPRLEIAAKGGVTKEIEPLNERLPHSVLIQIERVLKSERRDQPLRVALNLLPDNILAEETEVWNDAVASLLEPKALASWEGIETRRIVREQKALVDLVLSETDYEFSLSEDQRADLRPLLDEAIQKYFPDFKAPEIFSRCWYESYSGGVLFCLKAIPENLRDEIFTGKQSEFWKTKYENRFKSAWENIAPPLIPAEPPPR